MRLIAIHFENFRKFTNVDITFEESPTVLIGKNNSGKSSILIGIAELLGAKVDLIPPVLNKTVDQTNKAIRELHFQLTDHDWKNLFKISTTPVDESINLEELVFDLRSSTLIFRMVSTFVDGKSTRNDIEKTLGGKQLSEYSTNIRPCIQNALDPINIQTLNAFANVIYVSSERNFQSDEKYISYNNLIGNEERNQYIRSILYHLKEKNPDEFASLSEKIKSVFPEIDELDIELNNNEGKFDLKVVVNGISADINEMGSGTKSLVLILSLILFPNVKIVLLDEPDINLHDGLVKKLAKFLESVSNDTQIILASHHQTFINEFDERHILHVKTNDNLNSEVVTIDKQNPVSKILEDLDITQGNFEKVKNSESNLVILTEGPTDEEFIQAFAAKLGKTDDLTKISPIFYPRGGKKPVDYEILDKINGSPTPFLLIYDRDEMHETKIQKFTEKIGPERIHILSRREMENYSLHYETLFDFIKEFEGKRSNEINEKIRSLTLEELKSKILSISQELKQKTVLMCLIDQVDELRLINKTEIHDFIERNRNKQSAEAVDDLYQNLIKKIGNIELNQLRELLKKEEQTLSSVWNESEILKICPGKDLTILINKWLQDEFQISFSSIQMIKKLQSVDDDISKLISKIISIGNRNGT